MLLPPAVGLLLLTTPAAAARLDRLTPGLVEAAVVLCTGEAGCDHDAARIAALGGDGGLPFVTMDVLLELDAGGWVAGVNERERYLARLVQAREAFAAGQWAQVEALCIEGIDALSRWPGTASAEDVFQLWYMRGAAELARGQDQSWEYSMRQAAALVGGGTAPFPPGEQTEARRAFSDALRKLKTDGQGSLMLLGVEPGTTIWVDGRALDAGSDEATLYPGNHRITARRPGSRQTWKAEVPILAERTSAVELSFPDPSDGGWVAARLVDAFDTMDAPESVDSILADFCQRNELRSLRLVRLSDGSLPDRAPTVGVSVAPETRSPASAGEAVDMGDGLPATYEAQVDQRYQDQHSSNPGDRPERLRVVYFDPQARRFHTDAGTAALLQAPSADRFRIGVSGGYTRMLEHHHATMDLVFSGRAWQAPVAAAVPGNLRVEGRLGVARGDSEYNLTETWVDRNLWHAAASARWDLGRRLSPYLGVGAEVYIPVAVGLRADLGAELALADGWLVSGGGAAAVLPGDGGAVSLGLAAQRTF